MGRVSPVMDVANRLVIVERTEPGDVIREDVLIADRDPNTRADILRSLGVEEVICGTLSRCLRRALYAAGIDVTANVRGNIEQVLDARVNGDLAHDDFRMPGCGHGLQRRIRHQRGRN